MVWTYITMPSSWGLEFARHWGQKYSMFCVCFLSILLLNGKVCECKVSIMPVEFKNDFDTVG